MRSFALGLVLIAACARTHVRDPLDAECCLISDASFGLDAEVIPPLDAMTDASGPERSPFPSNPDRCDTAIELPRPGTYSETGLGLVRDYALSCLTFSPTTSVDAVYRFHLDAPTAVTIRATSSTRVLGQLGIVLRRLSDCEDGPDLRCGMHISSLDPLEASIVHRELPAGDYAVIVLVDDTAPFTLELAYDEPEAIPPYDRCEASTLDISTGGDFHGFFEETTDDYRVGSSFDAGSRDAAFRLILPSTSHVELLASENASLALVRDCDRVDSTIATRGGNQGSLVMPTLEPGVYYVLLENAGLSSAPFELHVEISAPFTPPSIGDDCRSPLELSSTPVEIDFDEFLPGPGASCRFFPSDEVADAYLRFTVTEASMVTIRLENAPGGFAWSLQTECGRPFRDAECRYAALGGTLQVLRLLPGTYYVVVEKLRTCFVPGSLCSSAGPMRVLMSTAPASGPSNRSCLQPSPLEPGFRGTVGDGFYSIELDRASRVRIDARPSAASGPMGAVFALLLDSCHGAALARFEGRSSPMVPATFDDVLGAGRYLLQLSSFPGYSGAELEVDVEAL